jgi:hypothetical protein
MKDCREKINFMTPDPVEYLLQRYEEDLKNLSWVSNRRSEQTKFLFELCDCDLSKLLALEAKLKKNSISVCPGTKELVEALLKVNSYEEGMGLLGWAKNKVGLHEKVQVPE